MTGLFSIQQYRDKASIGFIVTLLFFVFAIAFSTSALAVPNLPIVPASPALSADVAKIEQLSRNILKQPKKASLYVQRGELYLQQHNNALALADYQQAIILNSSLDRAWYGRGMVYGRMGKLELAIADMSEYIRRKPDDSMGYTKRGVRYMWAGNIDAAFSDYQSALRLDKHNAEAHDDIGVIYANRQNFKQAMFHFSRTIEIDPVYQKAYHNRALSLLLMGNYVLALTDIQRSLELRPGDRSGLLLKSAILKALSRHDEAAGVEEQAKHAEEGSWHEQHLLEEKK